MENSLAVMRPEIVTEWSPRNLPLSPENISYGSKKAYWWKGNCGHEWEASTKARSQGERCPICSGKRIIPGINDLASLMPDLAAEWSPKNPMEATSFGVGSHKKAIWKGKCGHEWEAVIRSRVAGAGCPYCSHNRVLAGFNDLDYLFPKIGEKLSLVIFAVYDMIAMNCFPWMVIFALKKTIRIILLIFFIIMFVFSLWKFCETLIGYHKGQESYYSLEQYISFSEAVDNEEEIATSTSSLAEKITDYTELPDISVWPQVDFDELRKINPDIVGWIYIEGTNINYPVVQGTDNDYYLKHLFDGSYNSAGCIFLDYRCAADFSDPHSIMYGHHMNNKTMFGGLVEYKKQAFYDEHSVALLVTPTAYYKIQFFSGYVSDNWSNAWDLALDDTDHAAWLSEIQVKSSFDTDYAAGVKDRIITLSTCTYEFESAKFVLHGYISETIDKTIIE